ncbi:hypothetical protein I4U23_007808 [Adineta vaga]|nr:hypothetical protein I4U23_007808 [Adineta vaga]
MTSNDMNLVAAEGFQKAANVYEQARPSYASEAIELIKSLYDKPDIIIDLGAGTGKLTRLLGPVGAREVVAIEPVLSMREKLKNIPLITKILDGTAEHIPFDDHTIDMIISGQAFHWFANHRALTEFHRVLKPNGLLILLWNSTDDGGKQWAENIEKYIGSFKPTDTPRYKTMEWKQVFENQNLFSSLQHRQFSHKQRATRDLTMKRILSTSFIATLPPEQQANLIDEVRKILENAEELQGVQEFDIDHVTNIYWCSPMNSSS